MTTNEIETFIEEMGKIGDVWTPDQVKDCYGEESLEEALEERKAEVGMFLNGLAMAGLNFSEDSQGQ